MDLPVDFFSNPWEFWECGASVFYGKLRFFWCWGALGIHIYWILLGKMGSKQKSAPSKGLTPWKNEFFISIPITSTSFFPGINWIFLVLGSSENSQLLSFAWKNGINMEILDQNREQLQLPKGCNLGKMEILAQTKEQLLPKGWNLEKINFYQHSHYLDEFSYFPTSFFFPNPAGNAIKSPPTPHPWTPQSFPFFPLKNPFKNVGRI